ncbi:MAG TPA: hypothetical protein V6D09_11980 [Leptolyngbyaceae cyanobacterium]
MFTFTVTKGYLAHLLYDDTLSPEAVTGNPNYLNGNNGVDTE